MNRSIQDASSAGTASGILEGLARSLGLNGLSCLGVLISLCGCGVSDGVIPYRFKGEVYSDSGSVGGIRISVDLHRQVVNDSLHSYRDPQFVVTDSVGDYVAAIFQGCSGTVGFLGIGERSDCGDRIRSDSVFLAIQCKSGPWKEMIFPNVQFGDTTSLPDVKYDNFCLGN
jgi:hypothetical protein